jgi:hypothetical protein
LYLIWGIHGVEDDEEVKRAGETPALRKPGRRLRVEARRC